MTQEAQAPTQAGCDKNGFILILVLTGLMFLYHQFVYMPKVRKYQEDLKAWQQRQDEKQKEQEAQAADVDSETTAPVGTKTTTVGEGKEPKEPKAGPTTAQAPTDNPHQDGIAFEAPNHDVKLSTAGASLASLTFTDAKDPAVLETTYAPKQSAAMDARKPGLLTVLHPYIDQVRSFALTPTDEDLKWVATADWAHTKGPDGSQVFTLKLPNGLVLRKIYEPPLPATEAAEEGKTPQLYHFRLRVEVENPTGAAVKFGYYLNGPAGMVEQEAGRAGGGQHAVMASETQDDEIDDVDTSRVTKLDTLNAPSETLKPENNEKIAFWGLTTKYFAAVVAPLEGTTVAEAQAFGLLESVGKTPDAEMKSDSDGLGNQAVVRGLIAPTSIEPGKTATQTFMVYVGPRQQATIFQQPIYAKQHFGELVYYGWFGTRSIGRLLGWVLGGLFSLVGNLGVAILLLTFMVRGLMLPLSMYSQRNMLRMQKIGPELNTLKEKYQKADGSMTPEQQRAFAAAQMDLFRKHNVNPVGCIGPIFLQMPIFIGLYNSLNYSSWLRHQPFFGWIKDLSTPDVLFRMPFTIPIVGTNAFSVLPLLMVGCYLLQMKVQPKPSDPKMADQQKMMKWMYPVFGFILYTMPSGLMLYFITSSLWGITEQKVIKNRIQAQEEGGAPPKKGLPGLSGVGQPKDKGKDAEPVSSGGKKNKKKKK